MTRLRDGRPRFRILVGTRDLPLKRQDRLWGPPSLVCNVCRWPLSSGVQRPARDADRTRPCVLTLTMSGAIYSLPQLPSRTILTSASYRSDYCQGVDGSIAKPSTDPVTDISRGTSCGKEQNDEVVSSSRITKSFLRVRRKHFLPKAI